jgi:hypothetical protein
MIRQGVFLWLGPLLVALGLGATDPPRSVADQPAGRTAELGRGAGALVGQVPTARPFEAVEMLWAILNGSRMGPGDGWFKPGQSRYHWAWLAARCDTNKDGRVTPEEFTGPAEWFARLDRSRDRVLTAEDFDWSDRSPLQREAAAAGLWFRQADVNSNGRISRDEWMALFERAAKGKGYLTADDLRELFPTAPPAKPAASAQPPPDMPSKLTLIRGLLSGEIGSVCEGPAVGAPAPDFTLTTADGKQTITLSQFRGVKPVVLVFGSFT